MGKEERLAEDLVSLDNLPAWADALEAISAARAETFALNWTVASWS